MKNQIIELSGSCYYNMLRASIEEPKEVTGYLYGRRERKRIILYNAYPIQTAIRNPTNVAYGNQSAIERLRKLDAAISKTFGLETYLIGGFHSDPSLDGLNGLSKKDINFIAKEEVCPLKKDIWIEIVLKLEEKNYKRPMKIKEFSEEFKKRLKVTIIDDEYHSYKITISAHELDKNNKVRELKIKKRKIRVIKIE